MFPKSALGSLGYVFMLIVACGGGSEDGGAGTGVSTAGGASGSAGATGSGGTSVASTSGADGSGPGGGSGPASGSGGTMGSDGASGAGGTGGRTGVDDGSVVDAAINDAVPADANGERMTPAQCLGANQACGDDGGTCCEAYVCRLGKCCVPTGIRSNCIANSDCCSNSCVLRQCTCAPLGYSCTGPGQCCSGFSCENGTCICPPDIRGCN